MMKIFYLLFLFIIFIKSEIPLRNSSNDSNLLSNNSDACEIKTGILISALTNKTYIIPDEYKTSISKFLFYSGTNINELGNYKECNKMEMGSYKLIGGIFIGTYNFFGLCYFKDCDEQYFNQSKNDLKDFLRNYTNYTIDKYYINIIDPKLESEQLRKDYLIGFIFMMVLSLCFVMMSAFACIFKLKNNLKAKDSSNSYKIQENETLSTENGINSKETKIQIGQNDINFSNQINGEKKNKPTTFADIVKCFNFCQNVTKILSVESGNENSRQSLKVFDGVRTLSIGWVVFGHTFQFSAILIKNFGDINHFFKSWEFAIIQSGLYAVDVFFMLSGFLFRLGFQKYLKQNYFKNSQSRVILFFKAFFHRYIRLLPLYLVLLFFVTYSLPFFGDGPLFAQFITKMNEYCERHWYHNLFYINNFINSSSCAVHTWYLANDMQFFILSLLIYIILNDKNIRNILLLILFIASILSSFLISLIYEFSYNDMNVQGDFFKKFYIVPWTRIAPYLIGIFFAELFLSIPKNNEESNQVKSQMTKINTILKNDWKLSMLLFMIAIVLINYAIFINVLANNSETKLSNYIAAFMNTFNKSLFVIGLGTILHLTFLGHFDIIKRFLGLPVFTKLARVSFGIYMFHIYLIFLYFSIMETNIYVKFSDITFLSIGIFIWTIPVSLILGALFESPVINLTKMLIGQ